MNVIWLTYLCIAQAVLVAVRIKQQGEHKVPRQLLAYATGCALVALSLAFLKLITMRSDAVFTPTSAMYTLVAMMVIDLVVAGAWWWIRCVPDSNRRNRI